MGYQVIKAEHKNKTTTTKCLIGIFLKAHNTKKVNIYTEVMWLTIFSSLQMFKICLFLVED